MPHDRMQALARSLAATCTEDRDYRAAATITSDLLADVPEAARLLCKGSFFTEAEYLLSLRGQDNLRVEIIGKGLQEKSGELTELLADCKAQLKAQIPRISDLRIKRQENPLAFFGGDGDANEMPDNVSVAPTDASTAGGHQSLFTRYSNASRVTSKTRRKEERKRARGKEGTVYEEEYLVNSVARLVERFNAVQDELRKVLQGLLTSEMHVFAAALNASTVELSALCESAILDVWEAPEGPRFEAWRGQPGLDF